MVALLKKLHARVYPEVEANKENSAEDMTVNKATGQPRKKNFLEKRMFGDYGQNKEDDANEWDDDFESSNPAPKAEKKEVPKKKAAAFDDDYDDDFGEESEGAIDDKKGLFDELAAGEKKTVVEAVGDSSKNDIPELPKRKESDPEGESEEMELTEEEQAKMIED